MNIISASGDSNPAEIEMIEVGMAQQFPMMWIFSSLGVLIGMPIMLCILLYIFLIAKQDANCNKKFGDWYGFTVFTVLPPSLPLWAPCYLS